MKPRKYSRKREAMLKLINSTTTHPSADWVFQGLREEYPDISLGTVYRNLVLFKEEGSIISIGNVNGQERFDGNVQPHGHFICYQCHAVIDIDSPAKLSVPINKHKVERIDITAYGTCYACSL